MKYRYKVVKRTVEKSSPRNYSFQDLRVVAILEVIRHGSDRYEVVALCELPQ